MILTNVFRALEPNTTEKKNEHSTRQVTATGYEVIIYKFVDSFHVASIKGGVLK